MVRRVNFTCHLLLCLLAISVSSCGTARKDAAVTPGQMSIADHEEQAGLEPRYKSVEDQLSALREAVIKSSFKAKLGKNDVISITVYGEPDLTVASLPIRPDGQISFSLVGDIQAEGLSVQELKDALTEKLSKFLREPNVSVIVLQFNSLEYTLNGEIVKPGTYPLVTDVTLVQAIAKAGGLAKGQFHASIVDVADISHATLVRRGELLPIDFVRLLHDGDMRFDVKMMPGDYVYIPSGLSNEVYLLGELVKADVIPFKDGLSLSAALARVTGFTPDADITRVHIVRGTLSNPVLTVVNLEMVFAGEQRDFLLKEGDIVYIPPSGLTSWSRIVSKIIPSIQSIQTAILLGKAVKF